MTFHPQLDGNGPENLVDNLTGLSHQKQPVRSQEQSCEHHIGIFYEILDCQINELDRRFSKQSCEILNGIAALCPLQQSFLRENDLLQFAAAYSVNPEDLKHEVPLIKKLLAKEQQQPQSIVQFLSLLSPCKAAFDCMCKLL